MGRVRWRRTRPRSAFRHRCSPERRTWRRSFQRHARNVCIEEPSFRPRPIRSGPPSPVPRSCRGFRRPRTSARPIPVSGYGMACWSPDAGVGKNDSWDARDPECFRIVSGRGRRDRIRARSSIARPRSSPRLVKRCLRRDRGTRHSGSCRYRATGPASWPRHRTRDPVLSDRSCTLRRADRTAP